MICRMAEVSGGLNNVRDTGSVVDLESDADVQSTDGKGTCVVHNFTLWYGVHCYIV